MSVHWAGPEGWKFQHVASISQLTMWIIGRALTGFILMLRSAGAISFLASLVPALRRISALKIVYVSLENCPTIWWVWSLSSKTTWKMPIVAVPLTHRLDILPFEQCTGQCSEDIAIVTKLAMILKQSSNMAWIWWWELAKRSSQEHSDVYQLFLSEP